MSTGHAIGKPLVREDIRWLMQVVLDNTSHNSDGCPDHECEFTTNPEKGACEFHEMWFEIAARYELLEWLSPEDEA